MGVCCSFCRNRKPRNEEREPLLPRYAPKAPPQTQFDKVADIIAAASTGKLPSQAQINHALQLLLRSDFLRTEAPVAQGPLSARGRQIVDDLKETVQAMQVLCVQKNDDDRIQDMLYQMSQIPEVPVSVDLSGNVDITSGLAAGVSQLRSNPALTTEEAQQDAAQILVSLRDLIILLFTSNAFRLVVSDVIMVWREIVADMAAQAAQVAATVKLRAEQLETIRPDSEERDRNAEGRTGAPSLEEPTQSGANARERASVAVRETTTEANRKDHMWNNIQGDNPERVKTRVLNRTQQIIEQVRADPRFLAAFSRLCSLAQENIEKVKAIFMTLDNAENTATSDAHASINAVPTIDMDPHLSAVLENVKVLLERFSGHNLDLLGNRVLRMVNYIGNEGDGSEACLSAWLNATSVWLDQSLRHPGWIRTGEGRDESGILYDWVVRLFNEDPTLKTEARGVLDEVHAITSGLTEDRATSRVLSAMRRLEEDLADFGVTSGAVATDMSMRQWSLFKQELWNDVLRWLLPRILRVISAIPLPRIELKSDALDLVVDRLNLSSPSFIPDHIHITNYSDVLLDASDATSDGSLRFASATRSKIAIDGLRVSARDIAYYMNAKGPMYTGWLDNGLLTIDVGQQSSVGEGIKVEVELEFASRRLGHTDDDNLFKVLAVKVDVPGLMFTLDDTRHWIFNKVILQPLAGPIIRKLLSFVLSAQIRNYLDTLNRSLVGIRGTATANAGGASPTLWDYLNALIAQAQAGSRSEEFQRSLTPSPSSSRFRGHGSDCRSGSHNEEEGEADNIGIHTRMEPTAKGIIRTSITETADGNRINETSIAVGIGEQILPGVGGPNRELAPTPVDEARGALEEIDSLRKRNAQEATGTRAETKEARDIVRQRTERATVRLQKRLEREGQQAGWRSNAFDI